MSTGVRLRGVDFFAGAGWTLLFFVISVTSLTGCITSLIFAVWGFSGLIMGLVGAGFALVLSGIVGAVVTLVLGVPLALGIEAMLRRSNSVRLHAWGAAVGGMLSAGILVLCYLAWFRLTIYNDVQFDTMSPPSLAVAAILIAMTGASAAGGWLIAWEISTRRPTIPAAVGSPA